MIKEIQAIFQDVLDDNTLVVTSDTTFDQIKDWDSAILIDVLMAIENEFSIKINIEDAQEIKSVGDVFDLVEEKTHK
ncbi:MAG: acyl carrier protein [Bdellovibrionales bacterium]|nr:acyl carrier protein [Bdellovibrionales bacterium]